MASKEDEEYDSEADEDFNPEEEEESDHEEGLTNEEFEDNKISKKRKSNGRETKKVKRKRGIALSDEEASPPKTLQEEGKREGNIPEKSEDSKKQDIDSLWKELQSPSSSISSSAQSTSISNNSEIKSPKEIQPTSAPNSTLLMHKETVQVSQENKFAPKNTKAFGIESTKVKKTGGLNNLLASISSKNKKISTLEKSQNDWKNFKQKEGIEAELNAHVKGADAFLEKQAFLHRTELREYERERDLKLKQKISNPKPSPQ